MKKDIKFSTRMAAEDREKIRALAAKAGMSMSSYVMTADIRYKVLKAEETIGKGA